MGADGKAFYNDGTFWSGLTTIGLIVALTVLVAMGKLTLSTDLLVGLLGGLAGGGTLKGVLGRRSGAASVAVIADVAADVAAGSKEGDADKFE